MRKSSCKLATALALAAPAALAMPAVAQQTAVEVSANAAIASEYRFRGLDLSGGDIAVQGGVDISHASGVYAGVFGSSLDADTFGHGAFELDLYGGWSGAISPLLTFDAGLIAYLYPDAPEGAFDYLELYSSLGLVLGPGEARLGIAYAPAQEALGDDDSLYLYADLGAGIPDTAVRLSAHLGYSDGFRTFTGDGSAFDWSLGAEVALGPTLTLGAAYVGAEGDHPPGEHAFTHDALVVKLVAGF